MKQLNENKIAASDVARYFSSHSYISYDYYDCSTYIMNMLNKLGIEHNFRGSNSMYRGMTYRFTPDEILKLFGYAPKGAFVFKTRTEHMFKPRRYSNDGLPDAFLCGIVTKPITRREDFEHWDCVGLWDRLDYGTEINKCLHDYVNRKEQPMTIQDIINMDKEILTPSDVAPLLGCDPSIIRYQAKQDIRQLGFSAAKIGSRIKIPRKAFIKWFQGETQ